MFIAQKKIEIEIFQISRNSLKRLRRFHQKTDTFIPLKSSSTYQAQVGL